jgi:triacylglycerol lipase
MISQLKPPNVKVLSLTTIATPHCGSAFADYMFDAIGRMCIDNTVIFFATDGIIAINTPRMYKALEFIGMETGAFSQLTRQYMSENFNPKTPDAEGIKFVGPFHRTAQLC